MTSDFYNLSNSLTITPRLDLFSSVLHQRVNFYSIPPATNTPTLISQSTMIDSLHIKQHLRQFTEALTPHELFSRGPARRKKTRWSGGSAHVAPRVHVVCIPQGRGAVAGASAGRNRTAVKRTRGRAGGRQFRRRCRPRREKVNRKATLTRARAHRCRRRRSSRGTINFRAAELVPR